MYAESQTQLFIETPYRNHKMIEDILLNCRPQTKLCIACGKALLIKRVAPASKDNIHGNVHFSLSKMAVDGLQRNSIP